MIFTANHLMERIPKSSVKNSKIFLTKYPQVDIIKRLVSAVPESVDHMAA